MARRPLPVAKTATGEEDISGADLALGVADWLADGKYRDCTPATLQKRTIITRNLLWFLTDQKNTGCGVAELKAFITYLRTGHDDPRGRWGNPHNNRPTGRSTAATYYATIKTLFRYLIEEGYVETSPLERMEKPRESKHQVQPFAISEVDSMIEQTKKTDHPKRNKAIIMLLLDTGMRASEMCGLLKRDVDLDGRYVVLMGKGKKRRQLPLRPKTVSAIALYIRQDGGRDEMDPVFRSERGIKIGDNLTRSGLLRLVSRLGDAAGIIAKRSSPHTFRHTFAIEFLRAGGNVYALMHALGHSSLKTCMIYLAIAQADLQEQHRQHSPVNKLK